MAFLKFSKLFNLEKGSDIVKAMGFKNDEELIKSIDELIGVITSQNENVEIFQISFKLHKAAEKGQLLQLKVAVNKEPKNKNGEIPLHVGAENGQNDVVKYLASVASNIDLRNKYGQRDHS